MKNSITIDLEDWYHAPISIARNPDSWSKYESRVVENTQYLVDVFAEFQVKATFFVLGVVAEKNPGLIQKLVDHGHEVGLHSYLHQRVSHQTPKQFEQDLEQGLARLQDVIGEKVVGYRAPMFSINQSTQWGFEILQKFGIKYDSSVFPISNLYYGIPHAPRVPYRPIPENDSFLEFPIATLRILGFNFPCGGGFYARSLPYSYIRSGIRQLNCQGHPAILYFHPWEFDRDQKFTRLTARENFTHYYGRRSLSSKLRKLLDEFSFSPLIHLFEAAKN